MSEKNKITLETRENKLEKIKKKSFSKTLFSSVMSMGVLLGCAGMLVGCTDGKDGKNGADGTIWKSGTSYAEFTDAKVGDYFIDTDDYILYQKGADSWIIVMENYGKPGNNGSDAIASTITINDEGYWVIDGVPTTTKAKGENGAPGSTPVITIVSGYWFVDGVSTNVKAEGVDGETPTITIDNEGFWVINGETSTTKATPSTIEITDGYWYLNGETTGVKAEAKDGSKWLSGTAVPTTEGNVGDFYLSTTTYDIYEKKNDGWSKIGNIKGSSVEAVESSKQIGDHYMISDGLTEMAANAVELVVDDNTGIAYAVYLASETTLGESSALVKMAKFNILQPTNIEWTTVFNKTSDFSGNGLSECNIINLNNTTVRVFAVNKSTWTYYYKDVNKKTLSVGAMNEVKFKSSENSDAVSFSKANLNSYISSIGGTVFAEVQSTTKILEVDGYYYTTVVGGNNTQNVLFMKSSDGATWTLQSVINHRANYEAMLEYHDGKFWVMCRNGSQTTTTSTQQNLMYSEDGITWTQSNLALTTSDTRPYLFRYQGELYLAYSSPMSSDYSTVRTWRCNIHIGKIVSEGGVETFDEIIYKESKFGIVYYALHDWYGNMIMLYSSGELNPTEGLMSGWSQGKDCLNYTILQFQEPELSFKTLDSISITAEPSITEYAVGDTFVSDGLIVKAKYSDGTTTTVTNYTISTPDMSTAGTKTITITYTVNGVAKTATFDIIVSEVEKVLESIEVTTKPTKVLYLLNETFSDEGLVVTANYNIGSPVVITNYTLSTPDMTTVGTKTITITYIESGTTKTTFFNIEVSEEIREYLELSSVTSDGNQYIDTGYTTTANTKVVVKMDKPDNAGVPNGKWLFNSTSNSGANNFGFCIKPDGAYVLDYGSTRYNTGTINWQDGVNTITIGNGIFTINESELVTGLNVTTTPTTSTGTLQFYSTHNTTATTYLAGTIYEISVYEGNNLAMHLVPAQRTSDNKIGFYDTVNEEFVFSATTTDFTKGPELEVKALTEIAVVSNPNLTEYAVGDVFDPTGLVVKAVYEDSSYKNITNYTLSTPDMTTPGTKTVTVTYIENDVTKTTSFDITVSEVEKVLDSIEITNLPTKTIYSLNDTFSSNGLVVTANYNIGSPAVITNYTLSTPDMTTVGTKTITVTYVEDGATKTTTFNIEVTELEYLELSSVTSDGNQYINTGYTTTANTKVVVKMDKPDDTALTGGKWLFNSTASSSSRNFGFNIKPSGEYVLDYGNTRYNTGTINWQDGVNTITIGNGVFTINDGALVTGLNVTTTPTTSTGTLYFLTAASSTSTSYFVSTIYEITVYEGDTLAMHLVPAQRKTDGKVGFYDTVSKEFVFSATSTDFSSSEAEEIVVTYTTLDYITANGNQYIDTGYTTTANTKVVVTMDKPSNEDVPNGKWLFSSASSSLSHNFGFCVKPNGEYVLDYGTRYNTGTINWQDGVNTITIGNGVFAINDGALVTGLNVTTTTQTSTNKLYLLNSPTTDATTYFAATIYKVSIYEGDTLAMELIPSQRDSDGKVGFYDTVSKTFITSATETDFVAGPTEE